MRYSFRESRDVSRRFLHIRCERVSNVAWANTLNLLNFMLLHLLSQRPSSILEVMWLSWRGRVRRLAELQSYIEDTGRVAVWWTSLMPQAEASVVDEPNLKVKGYYNKKKKGAAAANVWAKSNNLSLSTSRGRRRAPREQQQRRRCRQRQGQGQHPQLGWQHILLSLLWSNMDVCVCAQN